MSRVDHKIKTLAAEHFPNFLLRETAGGNFEVLRLGQQHLPVFGCDAGGNVRACPAQEFNDRPAFRRAGKDTDFVHFSLHQFQPLCTGSSISAAE